MGRGDNGEQDLSAASDGYFSSLLMSTNAESELLIVSDSFL